MSEKKFKPVIFEDPKDRRLRPLFGGRIANWLDSIVEFASLLFFGALVITGIGLLGYKLYLIAKLLASQGAWLLLALEAVLVITVLLYLWFSASIRKLIVLGVLAIISLVASPLIDRFLT